MKEDKIIQKTQFVSLILITLVIFGFVIILLPLFFYDNKPENFGVIGDALGGILNPVIAIAAALLTFLAFYIQKLANDELKNQFLYQKKSQHEDFLFKNFKNRITLIINEINNFNISFHGGTLISNVESLNNKNSKKYNFIGVQGIILFIVEYFNIKNQLERKGKRKLIIEKSYHAIFLHILNTISAFYNLHDDITKSSLNDDTKEELKRLLEYTYYSKFNYFLEYLKKQHLPYNSGGQVDYLINLYKASKTE